MMTDLRLSLPLEKLLHEGSAFLLKHACSNFGFRVKSLWCVDVKSALVVACTVNHSLYLCPADGSGAHGARLNGYVERAVGEILAAHEVLGSRYGLHFGVCSYVAQRFGKVVGTRNYAVVTHDDGSYRYFAGLSCRLCFGQSLAHKLFVLLLLCLLLVVFVVVKAVVCHIFVFVQKYNISQ